MKSILLKGIAAALFMVAVGLIGFIVIEKTEYRKLRLEIPKMKRGETWVQKK